MRIDVITVYDCQVITDTVHFNDRKNAEEYLSLLQQENQDRLGKYPHSIDRLFSFKLRPCYPTNNH